MTDSSATPAGKLVVRPEDIEQGTSLWQDAWHRLRKNRMAVLSLILLVIITLLSLVGPWLMPFGYQEQDQGLGATAPLAEGAHLFGTDELGRDLLTRTLHGGRVSLGVGLIATLTALIIGVTYGAISGYVGGRTDVVMMRIVDILYALPFTIFVIVLMSVFERDIKLLFLAIGAVEWLTMARIVRAQVLSLSKQEFIEAALSLGISRTTIIFRYLIPNVLGPVIVYTTLTIPAVMLFESILSFLGLGVQAPMSSWGSLIKDGSEKMDVYPWLLIFPAIFFSLTLFCLNFLGDGLRDALDPKSSKD